MRVAFKVQYELGATPIEKIELPLNSRDELPPVLRALQYIYATPDLNKKVFNLLENKIWYQSHRTIRDEPVGNFSICLHQTRLRC
jgi:hypothetical protein